MYLESVTYAPLQNRYLCPQSRPLAFRLTFGGKRRFFAPDKEKRAAFLRAQKNVAEQNHTKGRSPDCGFA